MAKLARCFRDYVLPLLIAVLILGAIWLLWASGDEVPVWKWAETNQGALSFVALVIAFAFALWEMHRANTETERRIAEYVAVVLQVADGYAADLQQVMAAPIAGRDAALERWNHDRALKRKTLDLLRQTCPSDARLVLLLTDLDEAFENPFLDPATKKMRITGDPQPKLQMLADGIADIRRKIADRG